MDSYDLIRVQYDYNRVSIVFLWNSYGFNRVPIRFQ